MEKLNDHEVSMYMAFHNLYRKELSLDSLEPDEVMYIVKNQIRCDNCNHLKILHQNNYPSCKIDDCKCEKAEYKKIKLIEYKDKIESAYKRGLNAHYLAHEYNVRVIVMENFLYEHRIKIPKRSKKREVMGDMKR